MPAAKATVAMVLTVHSIGRREDTAQEHIGQRDEHIGQWDAQTEPSEDTSQHTQYVEESGYGTNKQDGQVHDGARQRHKRVKNTHVRYTQYTWSILIHVKITSHTVM